MTNTRTALMVTMFACMGFGHKHYTQARIDTILNLLKSKHGIEVKRRWLFNILKNFEDNGFITRKKRWKNEEGGAINELPSLYAFTIKGAKQLYQLGIKGSKRLLDSLLNWFMKEDKRFPEPEDLEPEGNFISGEIASRLISKFLTKIK